jgi:hypothetical protein
VDIDTPESPAPVGSDSDGAGARRRLIGAGLAGLVGSLVLAGRAGATATPDQTTTTAPPRQPLDADKRLLGAAQRAELAAVALYDTALAGRQLVGDQRAVVAGIREAHEAYGQSLSAILGKAAPDIAEQAVVEQFGGAFGGPVGAMLEAATLLENVLVATHTELVGALEGTDGTALVASILVVEARHATVLADMAGVTDPDQLLVNEATPLAPTEG